MKREDLSGKSKHSREREIFVEREESFTLIFIPLLSQEMEILGPIGRLSNSLR